jgi:predicted nucleic acid-binding protein
MVPVYSDEIICEYREVLSRPYLKIPGKIRTKIIDGIAKVGLSVEPERSDIPFTDEKDRKFYDAACLSGAILVTGNRRHYPDEDFILSPSEFVERFID